MWSASIGDLSLPIECTALSVQNNLQQTALPMMNEQIDWQHRASIALDSAIASRHLISYAELTNIAQIPPPHRIHKLTMWLETLIADEHQSARPLRAAWVVSRRRRQIPAPGFFIKCKEIGLYDGPATGAKAEAFHHKLLAQHPA